MELKTKVSNLEATLNLVLDRLAVVEGQPSVRSAFTPTISREKSTGTSSTTIRTETVLSKEKSTGHANPNVLTKEKSTGHHPSSSIVLKKEKSSGHPPSTPPPVTPAPSSPSIPVVIATTTTITPGLLSSSSAQNITTMTSAGPVSTHPILMKERSVGLPNGPRFFSTTIQQQSQPTTTTQQESTPPPSVAGKTKFCSKCGTMTKNEANRFCAHCGELIK